MLLNNKQILLYIIMTNIASLNYELFRLILLNFMSSS